MNEYSKITTFSFGLDEYSVIVPAFNEEKNIEFVIYQIHDTLSQVSKKYEVIVINDGSVDCTGAILDRLSRSIPHLKIITHVKNQGYGAALLISLLITEHTPIGN